ncbi:MULTISPECIES: archaellin/type IV pilin N-terminal domain-containing protein [Methanosarcina]|uniref:Flagellin n=7 Tax=Methanosarcina mazei TaxID=2209 RepID=A0A0F8MKI8_METMZ|nr:MULTISPECIES: archaellin/type IV pilin N-terminal domain-containing protein [Methanosarcina]AAM30018.1 Flagellin B1 precursor [Methanosarcina mazei Go1]AGF95779.1 Flagellin FlaB1 [Methanosarcina mazei Tuc01]AKB39957.1 Flagellin FlaB1 [Methanosarcina mazei WWM610]AKB60918.1 Flagellin FlaB1 [Methanosarcina mazei SarPi]AKB64174.1 Flagellin FlaB1 [Methanosarcina mazei S-6]
MWKMFSKDEKGFTGLEAAIVLVAFVVVAAVFSYVMLGAGFYTTQKSQEVVHTGVQQASSSVELSGDVVAKSDDGNTEIDTVTLFLQLTSGGSPVDMAKTLIVVSAPDIEPSELKLGAVADGDEFAIAARYNGNTDDLIDRFEKFQITIDLDQVAADAATPTSVGANSEFQLEIKPPQGATYTIHRTAPAAISDIMTLV